MSNTSTVTPYENETSTYSSADTDGGGGIRVGGAVAGFALARWLAEKTDEDHAAIKRLKEERQRERLRKRPIVSIGLHLRNPESLIRSAERLGYRLEPAVSSFASLKEKPPILLRTASGERLAINRNAKGRIEVSTVGDGGRIKNLVRQHTLDKAVEHLARKGMAVQTARLANGEVQILARERDVSRRGRTAEVKAQVRTDGTTLIDIDCVRGNRCETIVSEFAQAVGGEVSELTKKDAYLQLPGEPTKTSVKV